jgi:hypothetical protein
MAWGKCADLIVRERLPFNAEPPGEVLATGDHRDGYFHCRNLALFLTSTPAVARKGPGHGRQALTLT